MQPEAELILKVEPALRSVFYKSVKEKEKNIPFSVVAELQRKTE